MSHPTPDVASAATVLFARQESRLAALDGLAPGQRLMALVHALGPLEARLGALLATRQALHGGQSPPALDAWLGSDRAAALTRVLNTLNLPALCAGLPELADTVLQSLMFHLDLVPDYQDRGASADAAWARALAAFEADWQQRSDQLDTLREIFGALPDDALARWATLPGLLQREGWPSLLQAHRLLARHPQIQRTLMALGRREPSAQTQGATLQPRATCASVRSLTQRTTRIPNLPGQTQGVHRSDALARMLPVEALALGHPRLRLVWHARRAERALLCYQDDDTARDPVHAQRPAPQAAPGPAPRPQRGPLIVCLDTSGSMQGGAQALAKAVVLEALRCATRTRRSCQLIAFGGAQECLSATLRYDGQGLAQLLDVLEQRFGGGTDITEPLGQALAQVQREGWRDADIVIVSDGEFGATPERVQQLRALRQAQGLRVQGLLLGDRETIGLREVCDAILPLLDWRAAAPGTPRASAERPIANHQLTALYFPGALRDAPATPADAALAAAWVRQGGHAPPN
ncbi:MAG: hypothetical protein OHK0048_08160 [Rhodoferax sp.]